MNDALLHRRARILRGSRRRREAGGTVMFLVATSMALMAAIGVYAMTSSQQEVKASGYTRQATQAVSLSESSMYSSADFFSSQGSDFLVRMMAGQLDNGGTVTGIIPEFLVNREHMLVRIQERIVTRDMHERKRLMFERSDAFVALPGGIGTLEELVEQLTWSQLGQHDKPIVLANIDGFWEPFRALLAHMRADNFIRPGLEVRFIVVERVEDVLPVIEQAIAKGAGRKVPSDLPDKF